MATLLKKLSKQKIGDVRQELSRAHLIIALLSFVTIVLLIQGSVAPAPLDKTLSATCAVLLAIVAVVSLVISFGIMRLKK